MTLSTPSRQSNWWENMGSRKHHRTSLSSSGCTCLQNLTSSQARFGHVLFASIASLVSKSCSKNLTLRLATCTNLKPGVTTTTVFTNQLVPITQLPISAAVYHNLSHILGITPLQIHGQGVLIWVWHDGHLCAELRYVRCSLPCLNFGRWWQLFIPRPSGLHMVARIQLIKKS